MTSSETPEAVSALTAPRGGVCVWFTGLSGAGKSTTANLLYRFLVEAGYAAVVIDGDALRLTTPALGFAKGDRDINVRRAATLACDIVDRDAIAVCALISPYRNARAAARQRIGSARFIEVFVDTPLSICEARDPKGLYDRARRGDLRNLAGVDDPYEPPSAPDLILRTEHCAPADNLRRLTALLADRQWVATAAPAVESSR